MTGLRSTVKVRYGPSLFVTISVALSPRHWLLRLRGSSHQSAPSWSPSKTRGSGQVATIRPTPMTTSNTFQPGHRIGVILVALGGSELALPGLTAYILPEKRFVQVKARQRYWSKSQ